MTPAQLSAGRQATSQSVSSVHHHLSELIFQMGENIMKKKINFPKNLMALFWVEKLITVY